MTIFYDIVYCHIYHKLWQINFCWFRDLMYIVAYCKNNQQSHELIFNSFNIFCVTSSWILVVLFQILPDNAYNGNDLLTNPLLLNKTIYTSEFGKSLSIKDIRINLKKSLVALENSHKISAAVFFTLLCSVTVTHLGKYKIRCYRPDSTSVWYFTLWNHFTNFTRRWSTGTTGHWVFSKKMECL